MRVHRFSDPNGFLERAGSWLLQAEAEYNLILGLADRGKTPRPGEPPIYLAIVEDDGGIQGCAFRTPPWKLGITRMPSDAVRALVDDVALSYEGIPGVLGPETETTLFASLWCDLRGTAARPNVRQGIHQLTRVIPPTHPPAGALRLATRDDLDVAFEWGAGFVRDTGVDNHDFRKGIEEKLDTSTLWFWDDGRPRSMAARGSRTPNGSRIGWVFTPTEWRGRGYASACVAGVSQGVLDEGLRFCFLYTDMANPTSNAIYRRLGYEKVCEVVDFRFDTDG